MQGRLSPPVDGKIQSFPWLTWEKEFDLAQGAGFDLIEWTLDQDRLYECPLLTSGGRDRINRIIKQSGVKVQSLTGDCFMQAPFFKAVGPRRSQLLDDLKNILESSAGIGIRFVLIPLVDDGRLENSEQEEALLEGLYGMIPILEKTGLNISFESDYEPLRLKEFIGRLDHNYFGITYDIGNSASLGYEPKKEIEAYGERIVNVHVKDRILGGTTVPLGKGDADFDAVFAALAKLDYSGPFVLQAAREGDECANARKNLRFLKDRLIRHFAGKV